MTPVLTEITGAIGRITLHRPDKMNAISIELADALGASIDELGRRDDLNVIVVRGAGGNFCAGGDFDEVQRLRATGPDQLRTLFTSFKAACDAVSRTDIPVVAAVDGVAAAGGFELMQAVDIVLVSETARISDNHINFGMIPGGGGTARLPRIVGRQQALTLLLSGDKMRGPDALLLGLAQQCYPADQFDESVEAFLERLAGRDRSAVVAIKRLVTHGLRTDLQTAIGVETDAVVARICGNAGQAGVSAFKNREATV